MKKQVYNRKERIWESIKENNFDDDVRNIAYMASEYGRYSSGSVEDDYSENSNPDDCYSDYY